MRSSIVRFKGLFGMFLIVVILFACKKKEIIATEGTPFDPSKPVMISKFTPDSGGVGSQMVIYGENFGNDKSIVSVKIGGIAATVISVQDNAIYCIVPNKAYTGTIEVTIGRSNNQQMAKANKSFSYQKKMVVTTLAGYEDERGNYIVKNGTFADCGGFSNPTCLKYDPKNPNLLYMGQDGGDIRLLNFADSTVTTPITRSMGNWGRIRTIDFSLDKNYMIIAEDQGDANGIATSILSRASGFKDPKVLTSYRQCNGASVHPVNGEMYFNSYEKGQFYRFALNNYNFATNNIGIKDYQLLFLIQDNGWEFQINIAPSGDYAYIVVINQHYILRTDYDWTNKSFTTPYVVCGQPRTAGWVDAVGTQARLANPYQGVFVRNPAYAGKKDQYDFYFAEQGNHDIRILTPEGKVTTFAGRGSTSVNTNAYGYIDGGLRTEARFDQPKGLAYDSVHNTFYVGDVENHRIRKISLEN